MESELNDLRRRVAALEAALAAADTRRRTTATPMVSAVLLLMVVGIVIAAGPSAPVTAQGPSRVVAPFQVVDGAGHPLFRVQASDAGVPTAYFYDVSGEIAAAIGHAPGVPTIQLFNKGVRKVGLGVAEAGNGLMELLGTVGQQRMTLIGSQGLTVTNDAGQDVAALGMDVRAQGFALVKNRSGVEMAALSAATDGSGGRVAVSKPGEVMVLMGILQNGKGDVCATGAPGKQVCLSGLAARNLIPY